jgi:hypothetical protein
MHLLSNADDLARGDDVQVARLDRPLAAAQPQRAAALSEVGEQEKVVRVGVTRLNPFQ